MCFENQPKWRLLQTSYEKMTLTCFETFQRDIERIEKTNMLMLFLLCLFKRSDLVKLVLLMCIDYEIVFLKVKLGFHIVLLGLEKTIGSWNWDFALKMISGKWDLNIPPSLPSLVYS